MMKLLTLENIDDIDGIENFDMKVTAKVMEGRSLDDEAMLLSKM